MEIDPTRRAAIVAAAAKLEPAELFEKFNAFPWVSNKQFMKGLVDMLGPVMPSTNMSFAVAKCLQARMWYFHSLLGRKIDHVEYFAYLRDNPSAIPPDEAILVRTEQIQVHMGMTPSPGVGVPAWQENAPKADLGVKARDGAGRGGAEGGGQGAPYPERFNAVIDAVTSGKPVPGVREIPSTVIRQPGITPVGKMQAPPKPWQKLETFLSYGRKAPAAEGAPAGSGVEQSKVHVSSSLPQDILDQEFPPVDADEAEKKTEEETEKKSEEKTEEKSEEKAEEKAEEQIGTATEG